MHIDLGDQYRPRDSVIHRLDPRTKVVLTVLCLVAISLTPDRAWAAYACYLGLLLLAASAGGLGALFAIRRSYVALPFMLAAMALPFTTPGKALFEVPGLGWTVSEPGVVRFACILLRTWLAVQVAILLPATTRFNDLLWALAALRLPRPLIAVIGFLYRYLFVVGDETLRLLRARAARAAHLPGKGKPPVLWQGRVAGAMVGSLFLRSLDRSERVNAAMLSRGYDGETRSLTRFRFSPADWAVLVGETLLLVAVLGWSLGV